MIAGVQIFQTLGPLVDGRVYPLQVTEDDLADTPFIIYQSITGRPLNTIDGHTGHEWVRTQIDIYHDDLYQCTILANKAIEALTNKIKASEYGGQSQSYDPEARLYRIMIDFSLWQTNPTE